MRPTVYLSSPNTQQQAHAANGMPVLLSFPIASASTWLDRYLPSFDRVLIDSGAFSELNSGKAIDLDAYAEWSQKMLALPHVDAAACLDDIRGDWRRGLANWEAMPWTFPVFHDSDPPEALDEILEREPSWLGLGMVPPRTGARWLGETLAILRERAPQIHIHGFALRRYIGALLRHDGPVSVDSTNWILDVRAMLDNRLTAHLTPAECLDIIVKRYRRDAFTKNTTQQELFDESHDL